jgi:hypothetical protein
MDLPNISVDLAVYRPLWGAVIRFEGGYLMGIKLGIYIAIELKFSKPHI